MKNPTIEKKPQGMFSHKMGDNEIVRAHKALFKSSPWFGRMPLFLAGTTTLISYYFYKKGKLVPSSLFLALPVMFLYTMPIVNMVSKPKNQEGTIN
jgi:hypothetical protein